MTPEPDIPHSTHWVGTVIMFIVGSNGNTLRVVGLLAAARFTLPEDWLDQALAVLQHLPIGTGGWIALASAVLWGPRAVKTVWPTIRNRLTPSTSPP